MCHVPGWQLLYWRRRPARAVHVYARAGVRGGLLERYRLQLLRRERMRGGRGAIGHVCNCGCGAVARCCAQAVLACVGVQGSALCGVRVSWRVSLCVHVCV